ncbi:MAG: hypothetical protein OXI67_02185 [Candidatus Poribacteria bacterium]|nr:hypothetical protein [Candidatus Poribacteria bacterium]
MKLNSVLFRSISLICILTLFSLTFQQVVQATEHVSDASQAMLDAQQDAEAADVTAWGWAGGLLGPMGILIATIYTPTPPINRMIGKSSEYVAIYTATYQQNVKGRQTRQAATGCAGATLVYVLFYLMADSSSN